MNSKSRNAGIVLVMVGLLNACGPPGEVATGPGPEEAREFITRAEAQLREGKEEANRASWLAANFITYDTLFLESRYDERRRLLRTRLAREAARYMHLALAPEELRKLRILRNYLTLPAPDDTNKARELAEITSRLQATYGQGRYCREGGGPCLKLDDMTRAMVASRDPAELLALWQGWRTISPPMKSDYEREVEIANEGARTLGFSDVGELWRSRYDMTPEEFTADMDRQWARLKPLYEALHCYVRGRLNDRYGEAIVPRSGMIPAHLLGNMWAQEWTNVYDLVAPADEGIGYNLTDNIVAKGMTELDMVRQAEHFFTSLGFDPLPETFWERSLFMRPRDRDVVCHASAWDLDGQEDVRIKMCIERTGEDFETIHHELGHNMYQREYRHLPDLFQGSAHDGFHEAMGDTISLSVTPAYLVEVGLLDEEPDPAHDIGLLLQTALTRVAFLPFGMLMDKWRWGVFSGEIPPERYNTEWWALRERYQGVTAPVPRGEEFFDPGAKYHIASNTPYARYFLGHLLQFQFHRAMCVESGFDGPLHRCSIYRSKEAGARIRALMKMGRSRPWQDALEAMTGERALDASAITDYYAPLKTWLDEQNGGERCGW